MDPPLPDPHNRSVGGGEWREPTATWALEHYYLIVQDTRQGWRVEDPILLLPRAAGAAIDASLPSAATSREVHGAEVLAMNL